eukprot:3381070-Prymnesium_polylepis.1
MSSSDVLQLMQACTIMASALGAALQVLHAEEQQLNAQAQQLHDKRLLSAVFRGWISNVDGMP